MIVINIIYCEEEGEKHSSPRDGTLKIFASSVYDWDTILILSKEWLLLYNQLSTNHVINTIFHRAKLFR